VTPDTIRVLISIGVVMMLVLLRLEAGRFGAAEYDEPGRRRGVWTRLSWYTIGGLLLAALFVVHPSPHDTLMLVVGRRQEALVLGSGLAVLGVAQAAAFARFRYGYLRLPGLRSYPNAAVNAIGTAIIDEAVFRGAILGSLLALGLPSFGAVLEVTIFYILVTRLAAPGRHIYMPLLAAAMGLAFGWATVVTGGLGAAIVGHAVTSFAVFVFTGHPGQVPLTGREPEEIEHRKAVPEGWQDARRPGLPGRGTEPKGMPAAGPEDRR